MNKEIQLNVVEAMQDDVYKGIARIDSATMKELGITRGDVITIKGNRETIAIADRAYPSDIGEKIIRIDGILRKNARTSLGEIVKISKANVKEAKKITIAPAQKGIMVQADSNSLRKGLLGRTMIKGDLVILGAVQRRKDLLSDDFGDDFGGMLGDMLGNMGMGTLGRTQIKFLVVNASPAQAVVVTENTEITLNPKAVEISEDDSPGINYEDIGGLSEEIKKIREMVEIPLKHPEIFERLGIEAPKGVLLHGPPGTGKTLLAKAVASETESNFILLNGPEIMSKFYGESEKKIRDIFENAEKNAPSIIFIDELDAIAPKREDVSGEVERRVVSQLLTMMDGLKSRGKVVVIGATNRPNSIDSALRRPGRFDREIEINVPSKDGRLSILKIHTRGMPLTKDVKLEDLAAITHGFVGADLESLAKEAAMVVLRGLLPQMKLDEEEKIPQHLLDKLKIHHSDFTEALKVVRPSAMREVLVETPNINWNDVGGLEEIKRELREAVEWPIKYPDNFKRMGIRPSKGILLYGPPGTGKTLLAKAVANETSANFIHIDGPSVMCVDGDTEILTNPDGRRTIAEIFEDAEKNGELIVEDKFKKVIHPKNEIKVFAMDDKFNITTDKVKSILRLEANETYKISTKKKGNFKTSKNQPFATLDNNGKVIWKKSEDLKAGDYVAIAGEITPNQNNPQINWFDKINKKEFYTEINGKDICLTSIDNVENLTNLKYTKLSKK